MAYDHIIAYAQIAFFVIDMESMINYLDARKFQHEKRYFNIIGRTVHAIGCTILYFIGPHLVCIFIILLVSPLSHKHVIP